MPEVAKLHVRRGDTVKIMAGRHNNADAQKNDKSKTGKVLKVFPKKGQIIVEGVNLVTKAVKPTQANPKGGFETREAPINVGKVQLVCSSCGKTTRIAHKVVEGKKVRYCKKCASVIEDVAK